MKITRSQIDEVLFLTPSRHGDSRGFFSEVYRDDFLHSHGVETHFVQDNHVVSSRRGILRGLHFQKPPYAQGKLVRCTRGSVLDVAVDIRHGSRTFGQSVTAEISAANWTQIWVPPGFAHGYVTLEADCEIIYKVTSPYHPQSEGGIAWDDPALQINWGIDPAEITLLEKDRLNPYLADLPVTFVYGQDDTYNSRTG